MLLLVSQKGIAPKQFMQFAKEKGAMCIDIFAADRVITIPVFVEQIWLSPRYKTLDIEEVYDFVIRNDDSEPISELRFLYPHDTTNPNDPTKPNITVLSVDEGDSTKYGWYFAKPPQWADDTHYRLVLSIPRDPFEIGMLKEPHQLPCRRLLGTPLWPEPIRKNPKLVAALSDARKSIFYISLDVPLEPGEVGVLRLRSCPNAQQLSSAAPIVASPNPYGRWPYRFSWDLRLDCARIVRHEAVRCLAEGIEVARLDGNHVLEESLGQVHDIVAVSGRGNRNTSVRIESHRLAVVAPSGVDITERVRQATVQPMGDTSAEYKLAHGQTVSVPAFLWLTGSTCNQETDLVHTVERVRDKLRVKGPTARDEIVREIATADRQEALFVLLGELLHAKLLATEQDGKVSWSGPPDGSSEYLEALAEVRRLYDHPQIIRPAKTEDELRLYEVYVNLHPFIINYMAKWECAHWLPKALHHLWNVILFILAVLALIFSIWSLK